MRRPMIKGYNFVQNPLRTLVAQLVMHLLPTLEIQAQTPLWEEIFPQENISLFLEAFHHWYADEKPQSQITDNPWCQEGKINIKRIHINGLF